MTVAVCAGLAGVLPGGAAAGLHHESFDLVTPPGPSPFQTSFLTIRGAEVFAAPAGETSSPPNAIRSSQTCPGAGCNLVFLETDFFSGGAQVIRFKAGVPERPIDHAGPVFVRAAARDFNGQEIEVVTTKVLEPITGPVIGIDVPLISIPITLRGRAARPIGKATVEFDSDGIPGIGPGDRAFQGAVDDVELDDAADPEPPIDLAEGPPTVALAKPAKGTETYGAGEEITIDGRVSVPTNDVRGRWISRICVNLNSPAGACDFEPALKGPARNLPFSIPVPEEKLRKGANEVSVTVVGRKGTATDRKTFDVDPRRGIDVAAREMDVTQGIQPDLTHAGPEPVNVPQLGTVGVAPYTGVPLVAGHRTAVRLYPSTRNPTSVFGSRAVIHGFRALPGGGRGYSPLPGSPITPEISPPRIGPLNLTVARSRTDQVFTFTLPDAWTNPAAGPVSLVGEVNPVSLAPRLPECGNTTACRANNFTGVGPIRFTKVRTVRFNPVQTVDKVYGRRAVASPPADLGLLRSIIPAPIDLAPTVGVLDTTAATDSSARLQLLRDWARGRALSGFVQGLSPFSGGIGEAPGRYSVASPDLRTMAHELTHNFKIFHASTACGATGGVNEGEPWPPDQQGYLHGTGTDVSVLPYAPFGGLNTSSWYDVMSYCGRQDNSWISPLNWTRSVNGLAVGGTLDTFATPSSVHAPRVRTAAAPSRIAVSATVGLGPAAITAVAPSAAPATAAGGSRYRLRVRNAAGALVSETPVTAKGTTSHLPAPETISAVVPAAGGRLVELLDGETVVASRRATAAAPAVRVTAPRKGGRINGKGNFAVSWTATDPDSSLLLTSVDYSRDGGRTWEGLSAGTPTKSVKLPAALLSASRRARVRVRVNDGFNETIAQSGIFRAAGRAPVVTIVSPRPGARVNNDGRLRLEGYGFDDRSRKLGDRSLRWLSGKRRIGHGGRLDVPGYALGRKVTLEVRDSSGRRSRKAVRIRVLRAKPYLLGLKAPAKLSRRARSITLSSAATIPGRLRVSGKGVRTRTFAVSRRAKRFRVGVAPGKKAVALTLRLRASGRTSVVRVRIPRG